MGKRRRNFRTVLELNFFFFFYSQTRNQTSVSDRLTNIIEFSNVNNCVLIILLININNLNIRNHELRNSGSLFVKFLVTPLKHFRYSFSMAKYLRVQEIMTTLNVKKETHDLLMIK